MLMGYGLWTVQSSQTYQGRTSFGLWAGSLYCVLCTLVPDCKFSVHSTMQQDRSTNGKYQYQVQTKVQSKPKEPVLKALSKDPIVMESVCHHQCYRAE